MEVGDLKRRREGPPLNMGSQGAALVSALVSANGRQEHSLYDATRRLSLSACRLARLHQPLFLRTHSDELRRHPIGERVGASSLLLVSRRARNLSANWNSGKALDVHSMWCRRLRFLYCYSIMCVRLFTSEIYTLDRQSSYWLLQIG